MRYRIELEINENGIIESVYQNEQLFRTIINIAVGKELIANGFRDSKGLYNSGLATLKGILKPEPLSNISVGQKITDGVEVWEWKGKQFGTAGCYLHSEYIKEIQ